MIFNKTKKKKKEREEKGKSIESNNCERLYHPASITARYNTSIGLHFDLLRLVLALGLGMSGFQEGESYTV